MKGRVAWLFAVIWAALLIVDKVFVKIFQPLWRPLQSAWGKIRPSRFSAFMLLAGGALMILTPQGRELAVRFGDNEDLLSKEMLIFLLSVGWLAVQAWYWARIAFEFEYGSAQRNKPLVLWIPRVYAGCAFFFAVVALLLAGLPAHAFVAALVGAAFLVFLVFRLPLYEAITDKSSRPSNMPPGHDSAKPRGFSELAPVSIAALGVSLLLSAAMLVAIIIWPVPIGTFFGAASIAFLAFGQIVPVGSALVIRSREAGFPMIATAVIWAVAISCFNDNHEVPATKSDASIASRPTISDAAGAWIGKTDSSAAPGTARPVIFIATAGGGLRAAYWTGIVLGTLQDKCPGIENAIFSISGVSGGSVGTAVYAAALRNSAVATANSPCQPPEPVGRSRDFLADVLDEDFLGPTVGAMLYPDLVQRFNPLPWFPLPDRGAALSASWNHAWLAACKTGNRCGSSSSNLAAPFLDTVGIPSAPGAQSETARPWRPILLLNGTHQETGKRIIVSNAKVSTDVFLDAFDLHDILQEDVSVETAALNSARFTYVSPAGSLVRKTDRADMGHVLDGGYFENYGAVTNAEIARAAVKAFEKKRVAVRPIIIQISSDPDLAGRDLPMERGEFLEYDPDSDHPQRLANEVAGPVWGLMNARTARGVLANKTLDDIVSELRKDKHRFPAAVEPVFAHFRICKTQERTPPLGWAMSSDTRQDLTALIDGGCDEERSDNRKSLAEVIAAVQTPLPVRCAIDTASNVYRCQALKTEAP